MNRHSHRYINPHAQEVHFRAQPHAQKSQSDSLANGGMESDRERIPSAYLLSEMSVLLLMQHFLH